MITHKNVIDEIFRITIEESLSHFARYQKVDYLVEQAINLQDDFKTI